MFTEQPKVDLRGEYFLVALTDNQSHPIVCGNKVYTEHVNHLDSCIFFKVNKISKHL